MPGLLYVIPGLHVCSQEHEDAQKVVQDDVLRGQDTTKWNRKGGMVGPRLAADASPKERREMSKTCSWNDQGVSAETDFLKIMCS